MRNEKGSTLIQVLLVILIFSVLGISLIGNVVGENKRVLKTGDYLKERNIARDGLTYFEADFKRYVKEHAGEKILLADFLTNYPQDVSIPNGSETATVNLSVNLQVPEKVNIKSGEKINLIEKFIIEVKSEPNGVKRPLYGYYRLDIGTPVKLLTFDGNAEKVNFSEKLLGLNILGLITIDLLKLQGNHSDYYPVPNDKILAGGLAGLDLLGLLGLWDTFHTMETKEVIAVRNTALLEANVIDGLLKLDALSFAPGDTTNVLINGSYTKLELLGILLGKFKISIGGYKHIDFKKLAVTGNALIEQDKADKKGSRRFTFADGLFVNKSLNIGGLPEKTTDKDSNLILNGDMAVMEDLYITNTSLESDDINLYVHGNAEIRESCINPVDKNQDFHLFVKGKLELHNNHSSCKVFNGLIYAEGEDSPGEDIIIHTHNHNMTINGGVIGEMLVTGYGTVTINPDSEYLKTVHISNASLIPLGRTFDK